MKQFPPIIPVTEIPETFENYMSPISWLAKLTKAYNEIAKNIYSITYDEYTNSLIIKEKEG